MGDGPPSRARGRLVAGGELLSKTKLRFKRAGSNLKLDGSEDALSDSATPPSRETLEMGE